MFTAFHVAVDNDSELSFRASVELQAAVKARGVGIDLLGMEQEHIGFRFIGNVIHMLQNICSDAGAVIVHDQRGGDLYTGGSLND